MISEDFINELKNRCDIEDIISSYADLKRAGRNKVCCCPFHSEKTPSMVVYSDTQSFYCFGCSAGGNVITFIKNIEHLDYVQAVEFLANKVGLKIPENSFDNKLYKLKKQIIKINKIAAKHFFKNLTDPSSKLVKEYLISRRLSPQCVQKFGLGYSKDSWNDIYNLLKSNGFTDEAILKSNLVSKNQSGKIYDTFRNRLMFPIINLNGNVVAFGGRILNINERVPKYLNSSDTPIFKKSHNLFGLNICKNTKEKYIILTEGYMDVIALHQAGFDNAVATLGTALTSQQARLISSYAKEVIISYDSDSAGQKATSRAINILGNEGVSVKVLDIKNAKDPDEFIKSFGKNKFSLLIKDSKNVFDFKINKLKAKYNLSDSQNKVDFLKEVVLILAEISNPLEREVYTSKIAQELSVDKNVITLQINKNIKKQIIQNKQKHLKEINNINYNNKQSHNDNIKLIVAENKIITILLKNPDFYKHATSRLKIEDFSDEINKNIYQTIINRLVDDLPIDITSLSNILNDEAIKKIAYLFASDLNINFNKQDLDSYIDILLNHKLKSCINFSNMNDEQLKSYFLEIKKSKKL